MTEPKASVPNTEKNGIKFQINGKNFRVSSGSSENTKPTSVLVDFIRNEAGLTGTKYMCREGGCGACVVSVESKDLGTGEIITRPINSCLMPVLGCNGWKISTIESLGNQRDGYSLVQNRLVGFNGTQCGFCSPGFLMTMHSVLQENPNVTMKEVESSLDGNICRCTGFRPILDAFKSLASDAPSLLMGKCAQVEEIACRACPLKKHCLNQDKAHCEGAYLESESVNDEESGHVQDIEDINLDLSLSDIKLDSSHTKWLRPKTLEETVRILRACSEEGVSCRIVAGNTSIGLPFAKSRPEASVYLDINHVAELKKSVVAASGVTFGSTTTISQALVLLQQMAELPGYEYGQGLAKHWQRIANHPVRSLGTVGGNLMIKHLYNRQFPSDIFITLECVGAQLSIVSSKGSRKLVNLVDFLKKKMRYSIIESIHFPSLPKANGYLYRSFKIAPRYENAIAYMNAAFLFKTQDSKDAPLLVTERPRICFGGISSTFVHASNTERLLDGNTLGSNAIIQAALKVLDSEVAPDLNPLVSMAYRKALARNLLYKTIVGFLGNRVGSIYRSAGADLKHKLVTTGKQSYDTDKTLWPYTEPIHKLEAAVQCSGEAEYINDMPPSRGELFGVFVLPDVASARIKKIDPSEALKVKGVVAFVSAKDIPGLNSYLTDIVHLLLEPEPIFVSDEVGAAGHALGLLLAETRDAAFKGSKLVRTTYKDVQKPILTVRQALKSGKVSAISDSVSSIAGSAAQHNIEGEFATGGQYHFHMETQIALCVPKEDGMDVFSSTQNIDTVQVAVARMLGVQNNSINVQVRRVGGAFGAKIFGATQVACACALGAYVTRRPVRVVVDLQTNLALIGKRPPYVFNYKVGFNDAGKIQNLNTSFALNYGTQLNPLFYDIEVTVYSFQNCYNSSGWELHGISGATNKVLDTYCRSPGSVQSHVAIETIMEHIANYLGKDPIAIRMANLLQDGDEILVAKFAKDPTIALIPAMTFTGENWYPSMVDALKVSGDYDARLASIATYNKGNRWMKRGMSMIPMRFTSQFLSSLWPVMVGICHEDGTVVVSHNGIEMGQGVNTKVVQVVAATLKVPVDKIRTKPANNFVGLNGSLSGADFTTYVLQAAKSTCEILLARMAPVKAKLGKPTWEQLVTECWNKEVDLRATTQFPANKAPKPFSVWGLALVEVMVDILTGEFKVVRADLVQDAGRSPNPALDVGQIEGAFIMGLGLWTTEKLVYDKQSGVLLSNSTWEYKVPQSRDIPEDFRVTIQGSRPNPTGVMGAKGIGEAPICLGSTVLHALKQAIIAARSDSGNAGYFNADTPITPTSVLKHSLTSVEQLII